MDEDELIQEELEKLTKEELARKKKLLSPHFSFSKLCEFFGYSS
ncbi:12526_t:CDS:2 [Entrophospora sp. SA101]|nr:12526_t:CDS:2 [Entrophospora sp. SA101]